MYQVYRSEKPFTDKKWLPFTGETEGACRQAAINGGLKDYLKVFIAQVDQEVIGVQPVPATAKFVGPF